jgi:hypothetical protein
MDLYERPRHYAFSHMVIGFSSAWFPVIGIFTVLYQLGQLLFNVRVFPREGKILPGNSVEHTGLKLAEILLGYSIGRLVRRA